MGGRPHRVSVTIDYPTAGLARLIERSLRQEVGEIDDDRSATSLGRRGPSLELTVDAADPVALRAATNTWLSLVEVAERTAETVDF